MKKTFKLPKYLTTVTPFSKMLALSMFVIFPILEFYFGVQYQKVINLQSCSIGLILLRLLYFKNCEQSDYHFYTRLYRIATR